MTGEAVLEVALRRLLDEAATLDVFTRVALIRNFPTAGDERTRPLWTAVPHLLAMPDDDETRQCVAALVDGVRKMKPTTRQAFVATVFDARLGTEPAKGLFDALAAVVGLVDREPG